MAKGVRKAGKQQVLQLLSRAMDQLNLGITITDLDGKILYTNPAEGAMHGYDVSDLIGKDARIFAPKDLWKGITSDQARELSSWRRESINIRRDGSIFPVQIISDVITDEAGTPQAVITVCEDITEKFSSSNSYYDPLTGLPNRVLFMDRLGRSVKRTKRRTDYLFALLYIDLDRFKAVNDSAGRSIGDRLLIACARRIEAALRFGDTVAHLAGDEFVALLEDIHSIQDATFVAERIQQHLALPFDIDNQDFYITASIGIAKGASGYDRPEDLMRDANTAMFRAKVLGRARHELFDESMLTRSMALLPLEMSLRRAIEHEELQLQYRPVFSVSSNKLESCEAILRWHHPERGIVYPEEFMSVAEETGMMAAVGEWMLQKAVAQLKIWHQESPELKISVRVTSAELLQRGAVRTLMRHLEQVQIPPQTLELQISETTLMQNPDKLGPLLAEIREKDVQLCLSDYGTGHASLENLRRFKINSLKLDRAFLRDILQNTLDESVATAMITLAHNLRIRVIADGVENEEQWEFLRWHRFDAAQGDLLSPPVSADEISKMLR